MNGTKAEAIDSVKVFHSLGDYRAWPVKLRKGVSGYNRSQWGSDAGRPVGLTKSIRPGAR